MYRPHPDVVCREIEGEAVLLHLGTGIYFGLNAVGTRIWQLLDAAQDAPAIVDTLALEYDADRETIARDVGELLAALAAGQLIVATDTAT
jgi:Coenzyme PQQ synthesis protein D (PqqD)